MPNFVAEWQAGQMMGPLPLPLPPSFLPHLLSFAPSIFLSSDALLLRSFPVSLFPPLPLFSSFVPSLRPFRSFALPGLLLFAPSTLCSFSPLPFAPSALRSFPCSSVLRSVLRSFLSFPFFFYPSPLPPLTAAPSSTHTILRVRHGNEGCPSSIGRRA